MRMSLYENIFLVRPDVSSAQVEAMADEFSAIISAGGGEIKKVEHWGLKNLAYRIKKNRKAHYVMFNIDSPHEAVHEMERNMGLHDDVMRHMTIRVDDLEEGPSAVMQSKAARDERRSRRDERPRDDRPRGDRARSDRPQEDKAPEAAAPEAAEANEAKGDDK